MKWLINNWKGFRKLHLTKYNERKVMFIIVKLKRIKKIFTRNTYYIIYEKLCLLSLKWFNKIFYLLIFHFCLLTFYLFI